MPVAGNDFRSKRKKRDLGYLRISKVEGST